MNRKAGTRVKASAGSEDYFFFLNMIPKSRMGHSWVQVLHYEKIENIIFFYLKNHLSEARHSSDSVD